jgi:3-oxoacyl-[acyl-carrier protein] reductase
MLSAGARVVIWDFSKEALAMAQKELKSFGDHVVFNQVDVRDFSSCSSAAASIPFSIDVLVNNAGITRDKSFKKMSTEDFTAVIDTNLTGLFNVTKATMEKFNPNSKNNRIINISSVVALYGNFGQTNYVAAKAGVIGITKTWAREFARKGFTVNAIAPGFTRTDMVLAMPEEAQAAISEKIPVGRLGLPDDIADACMFLASEEASYINGATLSVDGGLVC